MSALTADQIQQLIAPYLAATPKIPAAFVPAMLYDQLAAYLELLVRWNQRTNLTAIRTPEEAVRRHFGESLFLARVAATYLSDGSPSILDYGSGAGFPGLPTQLLMPTWHVTLAESQGKKASFLREAVRVLGVQTIVWAHRVEELPVERKFSVVSMRAVDRMEEALMGAGRRVTPGGILAVLTGAPLASAEWFPLPNGTGTGVSIRRQA